MRAIFALLVTFLVTVLVTAGTASCQIVQEPEPTQASDKRGEKLRADVEAVYGSTLDSVNVHIIADFTHPKALEAVGGRDRFVQGMKEITNASKRHFQSARWIVGEPKLYQRESMLIGVVPRTLEVSTFSKNSLVQHGTIVGLSKDDGKTWRFVNGTGFSKFFPEYAASVVIPKEKSFLNGVEQ